MDSAQGGAVDGMLAELVALPADAVLPIPEYLSYAEASTLPCAALTAWNQHEATAKTAGAKPYATFLKENPKPRAPRTTVH